MKSKRPTPPDRLAAARAIEEFLRAMGHAPEGELADTGRLVAEAWCDDLLVGYEEDPASLLAEGALPTTSRDAVLVRAIDAGMMCPHHLLPSFGVADVLYLPGGKVVGFGAVARLVRAHTRRLVLQEEAGRRIADTLVDALGARGALVRLHMTHTCFAIRGDAQPAARVETLALAGTCGEGGAEQALALTLLGAGSIAEPGR